MAELALDTGASFTLVSWHLLAVIGYDPVSSEERIQITTGSSVELAPRLLLDRIRTLGQSRRRFPVLCHTLPASAGVDGVLGLDFLRGMRLTVDFRDGVVSLD